MSDYVGGRNAVMEALKAERPPEKLFFAYGITGEMIDSLRAEAARRKVPCSTVDRRKYHILEQKAGLEGRSQGVIALTAGIPTMSVPELIEQAYGITDTPLLIVLDGITDPHNVGAIARSAECAGAHGLIISERNSSPLTPTAIKVSAGALQFLPVAKANSTRQALEDLRNADFSIIGTDDNATHSYTADLYNDAVVIVIGAEGAGISPDVKKLCSHVVSIPMHGNVSSLNASVAAGVLLFEAIRQRNEHNGKE